MRCPCARSHPHPEPEPAHPNPGRRPGPPTGPPSSLAPPPPFQTWAQPEAGSKGSAPGPRRTEALPSKRSPSPADLCFISRVAVRSRILDPLPRSAEPPARLGNPAPSVPPHCGWVSLGPKSGADSRKRSALRGATGPPPGLAYCPARAPTPSRPTQPPGPALAPHPQWPLACPPALQNCVQFEAGTKGPGPEERRAGALAGMRSPLPALQSLICCAMHRAVTRQGRVLVGLAGGIGSFVARAPRIVCSPPSPAAVKSSYTPPNTQSRRRSEPSWTRRSGAPAALSEDVQRPPWGIQAHCVAVSLCVMVRPRDLPQPHLDRKGHRDQCVAMFHSRSEVHQLLQGGGGAGLMSPVGIIPPEGPCVGRFGARLFGCWTGMNRKSFARCLGAKDSEETASWADTAWPVSDRTRRREFRLACSLSAASFSCAARPGGNHVAHCACWLRSRAAGSWRPSARNSTTVRNVSALSGGKSGA